MCKRVCLINLGFILGITWSRVCTFVVLGDIAGDFSIITSPPHSLAVENCSAMTGVTY